MPKLAAGPAAAMTSSDCGVGTSPGISAMPPKTNSVIPRISTP